MQENNLLSWMYLILAMGTLYFFRDEGVNTVIATAILLLNSHLTEVVEVEIDE